MNRKIVPDAYGAIACAGLAIPNRGKSGMGRSEVTGIGTGSKSHQRTIQTTTAKQAAAFLKSSHLSFASPEDLSRLMHTFPGAVSLLGLIFDQNKEISLYIDSRILNAEHIDCHPCTNDRSLILSVKDVLEKFLPSLGVSYFEFQSGSLNCESK